MMKYKYTEYIYMYDFPLKFVNIRELCSSGSAAINYAPRLCVVVFVILCIRYREFVESYKQRSHTEEENKF